MIQASSLFQAILEKSSVDVSPKFYFEAPWDSGWLLTNKSSYVRNIMPFFRDARDISVNGIQIELEDSDSSWAYLVNSAGLKRKGRLDLEVSALGSSASLTLFQGRGDSFEFISSKVNLNLADRLAKALRGQLGSGFWPIAFIESTWNPADLVWALVTSYGGLSALQSTSNPHISYSDWQNYKTACSSRQFQIQAFFQGEDLISPLQEIAKITDSIFFVNNEGKLVCKKLETATQVAEIGSAEYIADPIIRLDYENFFNFAAVTWGWTAPYSRAAGTPPYPDGIRVPSAWYEDEYEGYSFGSLGPFGWSEDWESYTLGHSFTSASSPWYRSGAGEYFVSTQGYAASQVEKGEGKLLRAINSFTGATLKVKATIIVASGISLPSYDSKIGLVDPNNTDQWFDCLWLVRGTSYPQSLSVRWRHNYAVWGVFVSSLDEGNWHTFEWTINESSKYVQIKRDDIVVVESAQAYSLFPNLFGLFGNIDPGTDYDRFDNIEVWDPPGGWTENSGATWAAGGEVIKINSASRSKYGRYERVFDSKMVWHTTSVSAGNFATEAVDRWGEIPLSASLKLKISELYYEPGDLIFFSDFFLFPQGRKARVRRSSLDIFSGAVDLEVIATGDLTKISWTRTSSDIIGISEVFSALVAGPSTAVWSEDFEAFSIGSIVEGSLWTGGTEIIVSSAGNPNKCAKLSGGGYTSYIYRNVNHQNPNILKWSFDFKTSSTPDATNDNKMGIAPLANPNSIESLIRIELNAAGSVYDLVYANAQDSYWAIGSSFPCTWHSFEVIENNSYASINLDGNPVGSFANNFLSINSPCFTFILDNMDDSRIDNITIQRSSY